MDHILSLSKAKIDYEKFVTDNKKATCINEIAKQIDKKQIKILLNVLANKIREKIKSKAFKN